MVAAGTITARAQCTHGILILKKWFCLICLLNLFPQSELTFKFLRDRLYQCVIYCDFYDLYRDVREGEADDAQTGRPGGEAA